MDHYVTGGVIRALREKKKLTQSALADRTGVSDKAVSKWETGRGLPDITLLEPLAAARFSLRGGGWLYAYCNRHGLVRKRVGMCIKSVNFS